MIRQSFSLIMVFVVLGFGCARQELEDETLPPLPFVLTIPTGLDPDIQYIPAGNPLTAEKVELGRKLFFDKRLSADNTAACVTCHLPEFGFTDGQPVSTGIQGQQGGRTL